MTENYLSHHGIIGQRWGIRRYQNKDGSLTPEGRKRLQMDKYDNEHGQDIVLKKGTKASRVIRADRYDEYKDPRLGGSEKAAKQYVKDLIEKDEKFERKYVSIDGVKNSGRYNGKEYYLSWFGDGGLDANIAHLTMYELKKDAKIASGKKVVDALLEELGSKTVAELLKNQKSIKSATLEYTRNKDLFEKVNKRFIDAGYDGIEDINDMDTDLPVILFNTSKNLGKPISVQTYQEAVDDIKKHKK